MTAVISDNTLNSMIRLFNLNIDTNNSYNEKVRKLQEKNLLLNNLKYFKSLQEIENTDIVIERENTNYNQEDDSILTRNILDNWPIDKSRNEKEWETDKDNFQWEKDDNCESEWPIDIIQDVLENEDDDWPYDNQE